MLVDVGLQLIYHPVHGDAAPAPDFPQLGIFKGHGGILRQPAVALMVALHTHDNELLSGALHVVVHAPGLAEGRVLVKENVMPVEHVHDGIPPVGFFVVAFRKIDVRSAGGIPGQLGDGHIPFDNHLSFPPIMKPSFIAYCLVYRIFSQLSTGWQEKDGSAPETFARTKRTFKNPTDTIKKSCLPEEKQDFCLITGNPYCPCPGCYRTSPVPGAYRPARGVWGAFRRPCSG